ncbi:MAG TPA: rhomboid family intramembrane serine protease [Bacteroidota bacterium]|nr:rhomboid family intramembrane serine protease [Bacteroidota bacterium]
MNSWTMRLIIVNAAIFILTYAAPGLENAMSLIPAYMFVQPWTIVTYMFMHASLGHIFFNMLALFFFGPRVELELGGTRYLLLYFISGFMGGILSFFFTPYVRIVGASGAIYGVLFAFAYFWPRERIFIWGIIPIEARWLVVAFTAISLFGGLEDAGGIAHFAHLGGFVGAYLYLKLVDRRIHRAQLMAEAAPIPVARGAAERWAKIDREKLHVVNREELDRIRMKIATQGVGSLTSQEIAFMDRFSEGL